MKFRLIGGKHVQSHPTQKRPDNSPIDVIFSKGDVLENEQDLATRWPEKFERVHDDTPVGKAAAEGFNTAHTDSGKVPPSQGSVNVMETLRAMNEAELRKFAEEEEIPLVKGAKKEDILKTIEKSLASPVAAGH